MSGPEVLLPTDDGTLVPFQLSEPTTWPRPSGPPSSRRVFAAAHVVPVSTADNTPGQPAVIDWETTLQLRHDLWSWGFGVAEAMDTSQRGMGLDWAGAAELIRRSTAAARSVGGAIACGVGTDQLDPQQVVQQAATDHGGALRSVIDGYLEQLQVVNEAGAQPIIMASRALAAVAAGPQDYLDVYQAVLAEVGQPAVLHWLGEAFDPALRGYWGSTELDEATATFLEVLGSVADSVDGVKVSLLDAGHEISLRRQLPEGVRMYTGDDYNYPELIIGDDQGHSDALLGIFAAVAPSASAALQALDAGDSERAHELLASSQALGRHIFAAPTQYYKTGIAFLAWLNGQQTGFQMVGGLHSGRSTTHLAQVLRLADQAGLVTDPELAAARMTQYLQVTGVLQPHAAIGAQQ